MIKRFIIIIISTFLQYSVFGQDIERSNDIPTIIKTQIETKSPRDNEFGFNGLYSSIVMPKFYQMREFNSAWFQDGRLLELAYEMRYEIIQSKYDGLNPSDYHLDVINSYFQIAESAKNNNSEMGKIDLANLDILLTDAYIMLSTHLLRGKVDPERLKSVWNIQRTASELSLDLHLNEALSQGNLRKSLEELYPSFSIYKNMRQGLRAMMEYQERFQSNPIASWNSLKAGKSIKKDDSHSHIPEIRKRLEFWNFIQSYYPEDEKNYDSILEQGIKILQARFGLQPDGVIGQGTYYALNQKPEDLIATAAVNMERLRWLPGDLKDQELILVNTANFQLDYIQSRDTLLSSRVIIGKSYHSTPQFSALMSYLVFSPTWTVPGSITRNEIIPAVKKDPDYLTKKNMKVLTNTGVAVNPNTIDWTSVNARKFPFFIRQMPGEQNALGLVKFMFPNQYSVYIHDTPTRSLFEREDRALSHGCIRIQKPAELAELLLSFDPKWTKEKISSAMRQKTEQVVVLDRKIPVVIVYITYWSDFRGNQFFRQDIYSRDSEIYLALKEEKKFKSGI